MANKLVDKLTTMIHRVVSARLAATGSMRPPDDGRGWRVIYDYVSGAWQADATPLSMDEATKNWAVHACISLIAGDIGKLRLRLVEQDEETEIWTETKSAAFSPVLRKPNHFQTRQQFIESWIVSKLGPCGNAYVLKERDRRGVVVALYPLDPKLVTPLISPSRQVFYRVGEDWLAGVSEVLEAIPASEIIHDPYTPLFHPLVGISPLYSATLPASQGLNIQKDAEQFFKNRSLPGGILTAPGEISDSNAAALKKYWDENYTGKNAGRVAVLGDGLKFEQLRVSPVDAQLNEQSESTARMVCSAYHVPPFKIGIGSIPQGQKVEDLNQIYYSDCLQKLIEAIESLLDFGLGLEYSARTYGTEFDLTDLLKMDGVSLGKMLSDAVKGGWMSPNEARKIYNLPPVDGGGSPMMQQQNWNLGQLAKRDKPDDKSSVEPPAPDDETDDDPEEMDAVEEEAKMFIDAIKRGLS